MKTTKSFFHYNLTTETVISHICAPWKKSDSQWLAKVLDVELLLRRLDRLGQLGPGQLVLAQDVEDATCRHAEELLAEAGNELSLALLAWRKGEVKKILLK